MHRSSVRLAVDHCQGPRDLKPDYESGAAAFQQPEETGIATNLFVPDFEPLGVLGQRVESLLPLRLIAPCRQSRRCTGRDGACQSCGTGYLRAPAAALGTVARR